MLVHTCVHGCTSWCNLSSVLLCCLASHWPLSGYTHHLASVDCVHAGTLCDMFVVLGVWGCTYVSVGVSLVLGVCVDVDGCECVFRVGSLGVVGAVFCYYDRQ